VTPYPLYCYIHGKQRAETTALTLIEQRERGMLPRAALYQENVISNEKLNRQRVEAGQIAICTNFYLPTSKCMYVSSFDKTKSIFLKTIFISASCPKGSWSNCQFSRSVHGLPLLVILSSRIHYASLHICRFLCEVAWLRVK
jgi:hypothetical protein